MLDPNFNCCSPKVQNVLWILWCETGQLKRFASSLCFVFCHCFRKLGSFIPRTEVTRWLWINTSMCIWIKYVPDAHKWKCLEFSRITWVVMERDPANSLPNSLMPFSLFFPLLKEEPLFHLISPSFIFVEKSINPFVISALAGQGGLCYTPQGGVLAEEQESLEQYCLHRNTYKMKFWNFAEPPFLPFFSMHFSLIKIETDSKFWKEKKEHTIGFHGKTE